MKRLPLWAILVLAAACSEQESQRTIGTVEVPGLSHPTPVKAPAVVKRAVPFTATVYTVGGGCDRADGAEVRMSGAVAEIIPYDLRHRGACTDQLVPLEREVTLRFDQAGDGLIRIISRPRFVGESPVHETRIRVEG